MSGMTAQRERLIPSRSDCHFVGVKTPLLSRFDMDKQAAGAAACDAKTIVKIQPVHISLAAAADWQWYPVRTATGSGGRRTQVGTQTATMIQLSNTPCPAATMLVGTNEAHLIGPNSRRASSMTTCVLEALDASHAAAARICMRQDVQN